MISHALPVSGLVFPNSAPPCQQLAKPAYGLDDNPEILQDGHVHLLPGFKAFLVIGEGTGLEKVPHRTHGRSQRQRQRGVRVDRQFTDLGDQVGQIAGARPLRYRKLREIGPGSYRRPPLHWAHTRCRHHQN